MFPKGEVAILQSQGLNLIIWNNSGIVKSDMSHVFHFGIWSLHLVDNWVNQGEPIGFWKVYNDEPNSGFILQMLSSELDVGRILFRGNVITKPF